MAVLPIRRWPDPVLSRPCAPVGAPTEALRRLADDMLDTMYAAPGRGLAAPQVGVALRLFVMDVAWREGTPDPLICLDPEIAWAAPTRVAGAEGCLSIPGITAEVVRPEAVLLRWHELDGARHEARLGGIAARCAQHEADHLDGVVTFDRLAPDARARLEAAYAAAAPADPAA